MNRKEEANHDKEMVDESLVSKLVKHNLENCFAKVIR